MKLVSLFLIGRNGRFKLVASSFAIFVPILEEYAEMKW